MFCLHCRKKKTKRTPRRRRRRRKVVSFVGLKGAREGGYDRDGYMTRAVYNRRSIDMIGMCI